MPRWQPGARERLQATTMELFAEQGFEATTVAQIASRAGLTERTFFRYFADKREVLFAGQDVFEGAFVEHIAAAPPDTAPFAVVLQAVRGATTQLFPAERRPFARHRQAIIDANPGLQERELLKLAGLTTAMSAALRGRGTPAPTARLSAECGATVFRVAFARWIDGDGDDLPAVLDDVLIDLRALTRQGVQP